MTRGVLFVVSASLASFACSSLIGLEGVPYGTPGDGGDVPDAGPDATDAASEASVETCPVTFCDSFRRSNGTDVQGAWGRIEQTSGTLAIDPQNGRDSPPSLHVKMPGTSTGGARATLVKSFVETRKIHIEVAMQIGPNGGRELHVVNVDFDDGKSLFFFVDPQGALNLVAKDGSEVQSHPVAPYATNVWRTYAVDLDFDSGDVVKLSVDGNAGTSLTFGVRFDPKAFDVKVGVPDSDKGPEVELRFDAVKVDRD